MAISYATRSSAIPLAVTSTIAARICWILILLEDQGPAAIIRQPRTKVTELSSAVPDEETTISTPTNQLSLLLVQQSKQGLSLRQQKSQFGNLENRPALLQAWQLLVDLSVVKNKTLRKEIRVILFKRMKLWRGRLGTIKATYYTVEFVERLHL